MHVRWPDAQPQPVVALEHWLNTWTGIGHIVVGMGEWR
jgi:hypothetical protein